MIKCGKTQNGQYERKQDADTVKFEIHGIRFPGMDESINAQCGLSGKEKKPEHLTYHGMAYKV